MKGVNGERSGGARGFACQIPHFQAWAEGVSLSRPFRDGDLAGVVPITPFDASFRVAGHPEIIRKLFAVREELFLQMAHLGNRAYFALMKNCPTADIKYWAPV